MMLCLKGSLQAGISIVEGRLRELEPQAVMSIYIRDPDGNLIEGISRVCLMLKLTITAFIMITHPFILV